MRVIITRNAENDLEAVYRYHADYSFEYADKFYDEIVGYAMSQLSRFPESGRALENSPNIRKLVFDNGYNIYYTVQDDAAYILFILDGRRILNHQIQYLDETDVEELL